MDNSRFVEVASYAFLLCAVSYGLTKGRAAKIVLAIIVAILYITDQPADTPFKTYLYIVCGAIVGFAAFMAVTKPSCQVMSMFNSISKPVKESDKL